MCALQNFCFKRNVILVTSEEKQHKVIERWQQYYDKHLNERDDTRAKSRLYYFSDEF